MPTTRKKVIKTVYKDEDSDGETGDFSDSGSEAQISEPPSSDEEHILEAVHVSSADEFSSKTNKNRQKQRSKRKPKFAKEFINKINKQTYPEAEDSDDIPLFSVKDLTDSDKLLPAVLNLSESDSSDDETSKASSKKTAAVPYTIPEEIENEDKAEYTDVWANIPDNSEEIAKKTFMELEKHKATIEETKASLQSYVPRESTKQTKESNVTDLLALGEDVAPQKKPCVLTKTKSKGKRTKDDSDSEVEDWEEVKESKAIPKQGLQLVVALPDAVCRKSKKIDVEMMMKRKINRVKKEHQVFMHKVHVLSWIAHGNYVSPVLNDQEIMAAVLAMVPKGCYPENRLDIKYVEQITKWYKEKIIINQDKHENKFRPKAPPLRSILLEQIKSRSVTAKKYMVFIFVAMLRALGLQCRIIFNFVTVPLRPPNSELCSLSTKPKEEKNNVDKKTEKPKAAKRKSTDSKTKSKAKIPQVDGNYDSFSSNDDEFEISLDDYYYRNDNTCNNVLHKCEPVFFSKTNGFGESDCYFENIMQVDGNDDAPGTNTRSMRTARARKAEVPKNSNVKECEGVSPPKRSKNDVQKSVKSTSKNSAVKKTETVKAAQVENINKDKGDTESIPKNNHLITKTVKSARSLSLKKPTDASNETSNRIEKDQLTEVKASSRKSRSNRRNITQVPNTTISIKSEETTITKSQVETRNTQLKKKVNPNTTTPIDENKKERNHSKYFEPFKEDSFAAEKTKISQDIVKSDKTTTNKKKNVLPIIVVTDENQKEITESKYFEQIKEPNKRATRKRSHTAVENGNQNFEPKPKDTKPKSRAKSAPEKSKYFDETESKAKKPKLNVQQLKKLEKIEDAQRVSHKDLTKRKAKPKNDVTEDLIHIIKDRIKGAKENAKKCIVKGKVKEESDDDSDFLPVEDSKHQASSDDDFKPSKISPKGPKQSPRVKPSTSKKRIDRRVLSSDDETLKNDSKVDVWCEVFVEELEQWIAVDVVNGKVHCAENLYKHATHPVCYVIGWDNNNYLKDLTRRYVPYWNTVTRKQRVEPAWWRTAVQPWLGPRNARDKEEDEALDRMQLEAPLPTVIGEYKNHPLYALKRHLLKYEAFYPPEPQVLGFVRKEPVYARECVYVCRSRDTWLKEAKVVRMGEKPYKIVKARPKWDRLSNKLITDKPLEVFGPWQVQDYEPPTAENGIVPRNAYGNVELFKECMLPKGTVHIKLPGLNKVCRKLNIDCAPAMTGFDFNGGWTHPVYDGFVVCKEFAEIVTEAWLKDQEEQERKEREKLELRVYGNWKRLIKGLMIRERLKYKYGFETPTTSQASKKKGPRFVAKKKLKCNLIVI